MKCKVCKKKITVDHFLPTRGPDHSKENLHLVLRCDCGSYVIPIDLVEAGEFRGLFSGGNVSRYVEGNRPLDGQKLAREAKKIYDEKGEAAYERWKKEVFVPLMDARIRKLKNNRFRKRVEKS